MKRADRREKTLPPRKKESLKKGKTGNVEKIRKSILKI